ncbi:MAG: hypothetical protein SRB1_00008 [Desulfobacteraceae bacterium Eth-SRB1]|nr:MAG: hypothetical protein SRB1_00008 [Desulfobacteraceae bacterium Eth-SRB1]
MTSVAIKKKDRGLFYGFMCIYIVTQVAWFTVHGCFACGGVTFFKVKKKSLYVKAKRPLKNVQADL